jgi:ribosomal protein S18 acetylase RimI-like enzyme
MTTIVRAANKEDFVSVSGLFKQLWPGKGLNDGRLSAVFENMLESDGFELLCAERDGRVLGFASLAILQNFWQEGPVMYITTMIVDEKHRGTGIGKALAARITEIAQEKGCAKIELESAFHRTDAHAFYEKMGFEKRAWFFSKNVRQSETEGRRRPWNKTALHNS